MGIEDFIFWLFLGFVFFSRAFAWLVERLRGQQQQPPAAPAQRESGDEFLDEDWDESPYEESATPAAEAPQATPSTMASELTPPAALRSQGGVIERHVPVAVATVALTAADQGRQLRKRLGLDERNALQRSILLMTVLGPCRANERETN